MKCGVMLSTKEVNSGHVVQGRKEHKNHNEEAIFHSVSDFPTWGCGEEMGGAAGQHLLSVYNKHAESTQNTNLLLPSYVEAGVFTTQKSYVKLGKGTHWQGNIPVPIFSLNSQG